MITKFEAVDVVKWLATVIQLIGYAMTGLNFVPYNIYMFLSGYFCGLQSALCGKTRQLWLFILVLLYPCSQDTYMRKRVLSFATACMTGNCKGV